jgi:putative addiction module antidote
MKQARYIYGVSIREAMFLMLRKIFKTGNSLVVSLPREMLESLGAADGSEVSLELEDGKIVIRLMRQAVPGVDEDFAQQLSEFIDEYRPALEALAK